MEVYHEMADDARCRNQDMSQVHVMLPLQFEEELLCDLPTLVRQTHGVVSDSKLAESSIAAKLMTSCNNCLC